MAQFYKHIVLIKTAVDKITKMWYNGIVKIRVATDRRKEIHNMQIKIYQIDETKDLKAVMFTEYEIHVKRMGKIVKDIYKEVFQGEINNPESDIMRALDFVFVLFNVHTDMFPDYKGHSLSVSDVVIADGVPYYVNTFDFAKLETF